MTNVNVMFLILFPSLLRSMVGQLVTERPGSLQTELSLVFWSCDLPLSMWGWRSGFPHDLVTKCNLHRGSITEFSSSSSSEVCLANIGISHLWRCTLACNHVMTQHSAHKLAEIRSRLVMFHLWAFCISSSTDSNKGHVYSQLHEAVSDG